MKKIIKIFIVFKLLEALFFSFFYATYVLFLRQKGFDLLEINLLNGVCMVAIFFFEIPTGAIADFWGRKISVVIGLFVYSFSFLIYFFSSNFWFFVLAEIIGAVASSCISGASDALLVDSLKHKGHTGDLDEVFSKMGTKTIGVAIGSFAGSLLGSVDLSYPWLATALGFFLLAFFAMYFFKEEYFVKPEKKDICFGAIFKIAKDSIKYGFKNRELMFMILFVGFLALVFQPLNMYWSLIFKDDFSFTIKNMGLVYSGIAIVTYLGYRSSLFLKRKFKNVRSVIILSQIITMVGIFGACIFFKVPTFLSFFLLHEFGRGIQDPLSQAYINKYIDNKNRATVLSLSSMISRLGAGIGLVYSGMIAKNFGSVNSWFLSAIILALVIIVFYKKR